MASLSTRSSYEASINSDDRVRSILKITDDAVNRGVELWMNTLLDFLGAMTPEKWKNKEVKPEIACFLSWFSLESADVCSDFIVAQKDLMSRFEHYWPKDLPFDRQLIETACTFDLQQDKSYAKKCVFVDRRASYYQFAKETNITDTDVELILNNPAVKMFGNVESETNGFWNWCSNQWGVKSVESKKLRQGEMAKFYQEVLTLQGIVGEDAVEFRKQMESRVTPAIQKMLSDGGRSGMVKLQLQSTDEKLPKSFWKSVETKIAEYSEQASVPMPSKHLIALKNKFVKQLNMPYNLAYFSCMADLGWGRILSTKSNSINQIQSRYEAYTEYNKITLSEEASKAVAILHEFERLSALDAKVDSYSITKKQINGLKEFYGQLDELKDVELALAAACNSYNGKFGSFRLMRYLADKTRLTVSEVETAVDYLIKKNKYESLRLPSLRHISESSKMHMRFGQSQGGIAFNFDVFDSQKQCSPAEEVFLRKLNKAGYLKDGDKYLSGVTLELFNGHAYERVKMPIYSTRAVNEFFYSKSDVEQKVFANNKIFNSKNEQANVFALSKMKKKISVGASFFYNEERRRWYLKMSPDLTPDVKAPKAITPIKGNLVLSCDLGWRVPVAAALLESGGTDDPYEFVVKNNSFKLVEKTELKHYINRDGRTLSLLDSEGRECTDKELKWFNDIIYSFKPTWKPYASGAKFLSVASGLSRCYKLADDKALLLELIDRIHPIAVGVNIRHQNMGGLSSRRIELFKNLISLCSRYISKNENDQEMIKIREKIQKKYQNLRVERWRVTANMIIRKAVDANVQYVFLEDLNSKVNQESSRFLNNKISSWYSSKILKEVERKLKPLGIYVKLLDCRYSSHEDLDGESVPRMTKVNPETAGGNRTIANRLGGYNACKDVTHKTNQIYKEATEKLFDGAKNWSECAKKLVEKGEVSVYIPQRGGEYVESRFMGIVKSDLLAAAVIGKRGLAYLSGDKSSGKVNAKTGHPLATT